MYINNSIEFTNDIVLADLVFMNCKASFGGVVLIWLPSNTSSVSILRCQFISNETTGKGFNRKKLLLWRKCCISGFKKMYYLKLIVPLS